MQETLYRRGADGIMERAVPEARGKAAAFDRWLAQGGKPFQHSGRFKEGPMKGLTYDQAKQKFETMWAGSPDALKEKYAGRTQTDLAPSERTIPGSTPVRPAGSPSPTGVSTPAPKTALTPARAPMQIPGASSVTQGPPSPAAQAALARRTQPPATPLTPAYTGPRTNLSPLAQGELAKRQASVTSTPTGKPVMSEADAATEGIATSGRVNPLTGLPMGYQPGDALPNGADTAMATRAAQSVKRQEVATSQSAVSGQAPRTVTTPVRPPTALSQSGIDRPRYVGTETVEGRAAAEMRRQAAINANPGTVNPDDPRKFFTGRVKPLTQLVAARQ